MTLDHSVIHTWRNFVTFKKEKIQSEVREREVKIVVVIYFETNLQFKNLQRLLSANELRVFNPNVNSIKLISILIYLQISL